MKRLWRRSLIRFITSDLVLAARKAKNIEPYGNLIVGVDPAGMGDNSTAIAWRRGHCIPKIERHHKLTTMEIAGLVSTDHPRRQAGESRDRRWRPWRWRF